MNREIIILDNHTVNQIAAGEVIEAPADVLKELIENSLDAGSTSITVLIEEAGLKSIQIIDDGVGIPKEELKKALLRHGTSKLRTIEDLYQLETMGFRGEALASIAAISKMTLGSKTAESNEGYLYRVEGGQEQSLEPYSMNRGTRILVENLFYNIPVRQKFLGSLVKETRAVIQTVERLALSRPDVSFELDCDGKRLFKTNGKGELRDVAALIFSYETASKLVDVQGSFDRITLQGLISSKEQYRGSRSHQYFFINNRWVKSKGLSQALERAYKNVLPLRKYPMAILHLTIPTYEVEVNVHPRKLEVKIENQGALEALLENKVRERLYASSREENMMISEKPEVPFEPQGTITDTSEVVAEEKEIFTETTNKAGYTYLYLDPPLKRTPQRTTHEGVIYPIAEKPLNKGVEAKLKEKDMETQIAFSSLKDEGNISNTNPFSDVLVLGVLDDTYILGALEDTLYIFDQHASHERIRFEKLKKQFNEEGFKSQLLLEPFLLELGASDYLKIVEHILTLESYGVLMESFGENSFLIRGLPLSMSGEEAGKDFLLALIDRIESQQLEQLEDFMIEKTACVGSVKAQDRLTIVEAKSLLVQLGEQAFPFTCPHGRPTLLKWTSHDLEKLFLRS